MNLNQETVQNRELPTYPVTEYLPDLDNLKKAYFRLMVKSIHEIAVTLTYLVKHAPKATAEHETAIKKLFKHVVELEISITPASPDDMRNIAFLNRLQIMIHQIQCLPDAEQKLDRLFKLDFLLAVKLANL